jgi:hypothetical protein
MKRQTNRDQDIQWRRNVLHMVVWADFWSELLQINCTLLAASAAMVMEKGSSMLLHVQAGVEIGLGFGYNNVQVVADSESFSFSQVV